MRREKWSLGLWLNFCWEIYMEKGKDDKKMYLNFFLMGDFKVFYNKFKKVNLRILKIVFFKFCYKYV